jgi:hypothetical protein
MHGYGLGRSALPVSSTSKVLKQVAVLAIVALAAAVACGDGGEPQSEPSPPVASTPAVSPTPGQSPIIHSGGGQPTYEEPVLLVPGDPPHAQGAGYSEDPDKPQFTGTVSGFRIYSDREAHADASLRQQECVAVLFREVETLKFGYLLPGTYARGPQHAAICEDGSTAWIYQEFFTLYSTYAVSYEFGEKAIGTFMPAEYVKQTSLNGHPAVAIGSEGGAGLSILAFDVGKAFVLVWGTAVPPEEMRKVSEAITCDGC